MVERIDNYADANYMSRSGLISFATSQYLNQAKIKDIKAHGGVDIIVEFQDLMDYAAEQRFDDWVPCDNSTIV